MGKRNRNKRDTAQASEELGVEVTTATNTSITKVLRKRHNIFKQIKTAFTAKEGLKELCRTIDMQTHVPRERVNVLLLGNHSSSKSSFINEYVGQKVLDTGVAIETRNISIVQSGRSRETLNSDLTYKVNPFLNPLRHMVGMDSHLVTEIVPSTKRCFPFINFIDTPGIISGDLEYHFDIQGVLQKLADVVDIIFVFFDPIGQSLNRDLMDLVEMLEDKHTSKLTYVLAKCDAVDSPEDHRKIVQQITQNAFRRLKIKDFILHSVCMPQFESRHVDSQLSRVYDLMEMSLKNQLQDGLVHMDRVSQRIRGKTEMELEENKKVLKNNRKVTLFRYLLTVPLIFFFFCYFVMVQTRASLFPKVVHEILLSMADVGIVQFLGNFLINIQMKGILKQTLIGTLIGWVIITRFIISKKPTLKKSRVIELLKVRDGAIMYAQTAHELTEKSLNLMGIDFSKYEEE
ncbi:hypothetical protein PCE1_003104 [Barthelona sp. PCE]